MYHLSLLEERIRTIYTGIGISDPGSWDIELIADRLKIIVHYKNQTSVAVNLLGMACIILDSRISKKASLVKYS
ncbi:hypothetical protein MOC47_08345 [Bacillus spizizenii]|uniref:hypothetical protein n=1 Tax=Bacillus TaxID=1386 RepID=UPI000D030CA0|nr:MULTISPECIES: hypothetical protein [Bacillus]MBU5245242.1 hypothetical protein [Bacillus halotolerans]MCV0023395.1 hypothetical protein [Bacillus sp. XT-2]MCV0025682.1 hypothetical protein [Bacillus sp. XT-2]MCY8063854.1 hypothetical protein [Bacillus spizizenii]MCY8126252.1 hypothetical protein [Bacillus spizizenii]